MGEKYFFSCVKYGNGRRRVVKKIRSHLIYDEIISSYTKWTWHGELPDMPMVSHTKHVDVDIRDHIEDMICDLGQKSFQQAHAPLVNLKARYG